MSLMFSTFLNTMMVSSTGRVRMGGWMVVSFPTTA